MQGREGVRHRALIARFNYQRRGYDHDETGNRNFDLP